MKHFCIRTGQVLAVAAIGTMGMSAANAFEWQINDDTTFGIGGSVELAYKVTDVGTESSNELIDNGSGLVFYGEHDFANSLTAYFSAEFDYNLDDASDDTGDTFATDHAYFGVRGNYGAIQLGQWDGIYDNMVNDTIDWLEIGGPTGAGQSPSGDSIAYFSPSFGGFSFAVQGMFNGDGSNGIEDQPTEGNSFQAVLSYEQDLFSVALGYDDLGMDEDQEGSIGLGANVYLDPLTLGARIESAGSDDSPVGGSTAEALLDKEGYMTYGLMAQYDYGPGALLAIVNQVEPESDNVDSRTEIGLNVNYELADNFYVYAEHFRQDREDDVGNYTAAGMVYTF